MTDESTTIEHLLPTRWRRLTYAVLRVVLPVGALALVLADDGWQAGDVWALVLAGLGGAGFHLAKVNTPAQ